MENDIKTFYNLVAERTADEWYSNNLLLPSIREFLSLMPSNPRILDLGCGPGYESMRLHDEGADVLGIDFSEENVRIAKERCKSCQFEVMDFTNLDQRFGHFDGVFASASLIHIPPNKIEDVFMRISEILNDRGFLLASLRDGEGINESMSDLTVDGRKLRRTVYQYTKEQIVNYSEKNGLVFIKEGYLDSSLQEYGWKSYIFQKRKTV
jgi:2-polyprenyl-3-methyl-5-hydroxy-6-metoxy-1,4-benzoquinol methylase